jgi:hypothetical protein
MAKINIYRNSDGSVHYFHVLEAVTRLQALAEVAKILHKPLDEVSKEFGRCIPAGIGWLIMRSEK